MARITENQLILPSLYLMSMSPDKQISTSRLIPLLRELLKPTGEDLEILNGRNDDKFSQIVRNLKAHNTFNHNGYATYKNGIFHLTTSGKKYLDKNIEIIQYLLINDFIWEDLKTGFETAYEEIARKRKIEVFDESIMVHEGMKRIVETSVYARSLKLRELAINHYMANGKIFCKVCNFNFEDFYGPDLGKSYIEIHHLKPVFKYEDDDLDQFIGTALSNVVPVCANCHRMIHRDRSNPLALSHLINSISLNGKYIHIHS